MWLNGNDISSLEVCGRGYVYEFDPLLITVSAGLRRIEGIKRSQSSSQQDYYNWQVTESFVSTRNIKLVWQHDLFLGGKHCVKDSCSSCHLFNVVGTGSSL